MTVTVRLWRSWIINVWSLELILLLIYGSSFLKTNLNSLYWFYSLLNPLLELFFSISWLLWLVCPAVLLSYCIWSTGRGGLPSFVYWMMKKCNLKIQSNVELYVMGIDFDICPLLFRMWERIKISINYDFCVTLNSSIPFRLFRTPYCD